MSLPPERLLTVDGNTDFITNPYFVSDAINSTTLALAGALANIDKQDPTSKDLTWGNIYNEADAILGSLGWILESTRTTDTPVCAKDGSTVQEAMVSVYQSLGGADVRELGELLQANNQAVLDPEAADVIESWLSDSVCLDDDTDCVSGNEDSASILYLHEGQQPVDLTVTGYTTYFSGNKGTTRQASSLSIRRTVVSKWTINQSLYDQVRDLVAEKVANSTKASAQLAGPAFVLDRDEVVVQPFDPAALVDCKGENDALHDVDPSTEDHADTGNANPDVTGSIGGLRGNSSSAASFGAGVWWMISSTTLVCGIFEDLW